VAEEQRILRGELGYKKMTKGVPVPGEEFQYSRREKSHNSGGNENRQKKNPRKKRNSKSKIVASSEIGLEG